MDTELEPIKDINSLVPGQIVPSGHCPGCGHFCFPKREELSLEWMQRLQNTLNVIARSVNETRGLLEEVNATPTCFAVGAVLADCLRMVQRTLANEFHLTMITDEQAAAIQQAINEAAEELEEEIDVSPLGAVSPKPQQDN